VTDEPRPEAPANRPTALIVDDHGGFREVARALLEESGFSVVGEAADGGEAIAAVGALHPWLVLLDVQLPGLDGFEVAARLAEAPDPPRVVLTSTRDAASYRRRLAASPAVVFVPKSELSVAVLAAFAP
jgi:DNA-binding NarL/FixJ family response regulator